LLLAAPDVKVNEEEIVVKDTILVLDHLNPLDRFAIVSFATTTRSFSPQSRARYPRPIRERISWARSTSI
uniref:hypothetical protein n=1 Tax=Methanothrix sp. TaxID=90426 RepID=UPI003297C9C6